MPRAATLRPSRRSRPRGARRSGDRLPAALARLFWDHPARTLRLCRDRDLIVRRAASEGGLEAIRLLRSRVGDDAIREVILRTGARGLSPQRIRFWQLLLGLPVRRADAWVRLARSGTWARRAGR